MTERQASPRPRERRNEVNLSRIVLAVVVVLFSAALVAHGQNTGRVVFGRTSGSIPQPGIPDAAVVPAGSQFIGHADTTVSDGGKITYRGNVTIEFSAASIVVQADEVTYDEDAKQLILQGSAHIALDRK